MSSVNTMDFMQASTLLNALRKQMTGQSSLAAADESTFVSVATSLLQMGVDPIMSAISQLIGRTIFSIRPYYAKLAGLEVDSQRWGYITRKLSIADKDFTDDSGFALSDGYSVDMYTVNKPNILAMQYYGQNIFQKYYTIFRNQLNSAFSGSQQFGEFMTMVTQNSLDMIEQNREVVRRMTLNNFIAGKLDAESNLVSAEENGVVHCITEYNADTGSSVTSTTVFAKENFDDFCKWLYARVAAISNLMTERTQLFQINVSGKAVQRHTPKQDQRMYMYAPILAQISARVQSDTFNDELIEYTNMEPINFWQSALTPDSINVKPVYLKAADGELKVASAAVSQSGILGVIFDRDALGVTIMDEETSTTPYNSAGRYWNIYYSFIQRYWNDFTEKFCVFVLD